MIQYCVVGIAALGMTLSACQKSSPAAEPKTELVAAKALSGEDYLRRGVPNADRQWMSNDYISAAKALTAIAAEDARLLPRYQASGVSGAVFTRMTSAENLAIFKNASLPIGQRVGLAIESGPALKRVMLVYMKASTQDLRFGAELVELMACQLALIDASLTLVEAFAQTLDPKDPTYATRMAGLKKMKQGVATVVSGGLLTLSETGFYATRDLVRLASHLEKTLPSILKQLPPAVRIESTVRIDGLLTSDLPLPLKAALKTLNLALRA